MGLYMYFFDQVEFERRYNCTTYSVDVVPIAKRIHPYFGLLFIFLGIFYESLYIPVIYALSQKNVRKLGFCYEIMLSMTIYGLISMPFTSMMTGFYAINGDVHCTDQEAMFFTGLILMSLWCGYSQTSVLLAFNRCMLLNRWSGFLFRGRQRFLWFLYPLCWSLAVLIFGNPGFYNSVYNVWLFDPHKGYVEDSSFSYIHPIQIANNCVIILFLPVIYINFYTKYMKPVDNEPNRMTDQEYALLMQALAVNVTIAVATFFYTVLQFCGLPSFLLPLANLSWIFVQGFPAILYLMFNYHVRDVIFREIAWINAIQDQLEITREILDRQAAEGTVHPTEPDPKSCPNWFILMLLMYILNCLVVFID
ncbi:hypothetical protein M3Y97_01026700 [Aphelenchoides bicaudatus]|nr:hypothetical protein M3Y97_01026700 [Aphelenchoides bicaudatus]